MYMTNILYLVCARRGQLFQFLLHDLLEGDVADCILFATRTVRRYIERDNSAVEFR